MDLIPTLRRDYILNLLKDKMRVDNRALDEYREVKIEYDPIPRSEGSASVKIGNTRVMAGVKMDVGTPFPDTPEEGVVMVNAELLPLASPEFEPGKPDEATIELARVVDRGIRESKAIDLAKLCITPKEKVWMVFIDLWVLDYDGNLFDTSSLASIAALNRARIPKYEDEAVVREGMKDKLPVKRTPISTTFAKFGNDLLLDPCYEEESSMDGRITINFDEDDNVVAAQKGMSSDFSYENIAEAIDIGKIKSEELRKLLG